MEPTITTHSTIKKLSANNDFTPTQAEKIVDANLDLAQNLATKNDLQKLDHKFERKFDRLEARVDSMEQKFDIKFDALELKVDTKIDALDKKIDREARGLKSDLTARMWTIQAASTSIVIGAMALMLTLMR